MDEHARSFLVEAVRALARRLRVEEAAILPVRAEQGVFGPRPAEGSASGSARPVTRHVLLSQPLSLPDDLAALARVVAECRRCALHATRTHVVFGEGREGCDVMFVGEGPGAEEDATGRPFVGAAGRLLDRMIAAMGMAREDCYIANVVKCRPPFNATPRPDEVAACLPYLQRQVALVRPRVLVALGRSAAVALTGRQEAVTRLRGEWFSYRVGDLSRSEARTPGDIPVIVTYHPAALLRNPDWKPQAWHDLKRVMARLGRPLPRAGAEPERDHGR